MPPNQIIIKPSMPPRPMGSIFTAIPGVCSEFERIAGVRARPDIPLIADITRYNIGGAATRITITEIEKIDASSVAVLLRLASDDNISLDCNSVQDAVLSSTMRRALLNHAFDDAQDPLSEMVTTHAHQFPLLEGSEHAHVARSALQAGIDGDSSKAADGLRAASRLAHARGHYAESAEYLDSAIVWNSTSPQLHEDRAAAYARIEMQLAGKMWSRAATAYDDCGERSSAIRCRVLGLRARESFAGPEEYESLAVSDVGGWAVYASAIACSLAENHSGAVEAAQRAAEFAREHVDMQLLARACEMASLGLGYTGHLDKAIRFQREAIDAIVAERMEDREVRARANLIDMLLEQLEMTMALDESAALLSRCRTLNLTREMPVALAVRLRVLIDAGQCHEAAKIEPELRNALSWPTEDLRTDFARFQLARSAAILGTPAPDIASPDGSDGVTYVSFERERSIALLWQHLDSPLQVSAAPSTERDWNAEPSSAAEHDLLLVRLRALGAPVDIDTLNATQRTGAMSGFQRRAIHEIEMALGEVMDLTAPGRMWNHSGCKIESLFAELVAAMRDANYERLSSLRANAADLGAFGLSRAIQRVEQQYLGTSQQRWPDGSIIARQVAGAEELLCSSKTVKVRRGELFIPSPSARLAVVVSGRLLVGGSAEELRTVALDIAERGDTLGEEHLVSTGAALAAEATIDSVLAVVNENVFNRIIQQHVGLREELVSQYAWRMRRAASLVGEMTALDSDRRFARLVITLNERFGRDRLDGSRLIDRVFNQEELGRLIGVSRKSIVRALRDLRDAEVVALERRHLHILDTDQLMRFAASGEFDANAA